MNWFEADNGFLVNLDKVKAVQRSTDYTSTIFFSLGDPFESVTCSMPYESLKSILQMRSDRQEDSARYLKTLSSGSFTPVP